MDKAVCTIVYGNDAPKWEHWMRKSLKNVMPNAPYRIITPDLHRLDEFLYPRERRGYCGCAKAEINGTCWVVDVDLLFLKPLIWEPSKPQTVLAATPGGDEKYLELMDKAGVPVTTQRTINCGVLWIKENLWSYWEKWYRRIYKAMWDTPYHISECTWNAIFHDLYSQGKAEFLPQEYNQIVSEHGPYGARIFHLAGTPEQFREQLMESYFKFFWGDK